MAGQKKHLKKVNNQVAAFIVVSAALIAPVAVSDNSANASADSGMVQVNNIMRYAGPAINPVIPADIQVEPPVLRYGGPINPAIPAIYEPVEPMPRPLVKYAGPVNPVIPVNYVEPDYIEPANSIPNPAIVKYAGPQMPDAGLNINNNFNFNTAIPAKYGLEQISPGHYIFR